MQMCGLTTPHPRHHPSPAPTFQLPFWETLCGDSPGRWSPGILSFPLSSQRSTITGLGWE